MTGPPPQSPKGGSYRIEVDRKKQIPRAGGGLGGLALLFLGWSLIICLLAAQCRNPFAPTESSQPADRHTAYTSRRTG